MYLVFGNVKWSIGLMGISMSVMWLILVLV